MITAILIFLLLFQFLIVVINVAVLIHGDGDYLNATGAITGVLSAFLFLALLV